MQANKKTMLFLIPSMLIFLVSSCSIPQEPVGYTPLPDLDQVHRSSSVTKRFRESAPQGPTAVESAIGLSEKYAKLSAETAKLRQKNQGLIAENHRLTDQVAALDGQLQQTQRELAEANGLLMELVVELNNWKTNVIGFREEMRGAEKAQLEALLKILKVLGGEVKAELPQSKEKPKTQKTESGLPGNAGSYAASSNKPAQPQSQ